MLRTSICTSSVQVRMAESWDCPALMGENIAGLSILNCTGACWLMVLCWIQLSLGGHWILPGARASPMCSLALCLHNWGKRTKEVARPKLPAHPLSAQFYDSVIHWPVQEGSNFLISTPAVRYPVHCWNNIHNCQQDLCSAGGWAQWDWVPRLSMIERTETWGKREKNQTLITLNI